MGFELGGGPLRRAPRGWLPARAFPLRHSVYSHPDLGAERGETVIETSAGLTVVWRVEVEGRAPYELEEERSAPMWLHSNALGSGNRWYKVRVRPQYGLMSDLGVPGVVDPGDPARLWIDWDAAYAEHVPAWEVEARVRREAARRSGALEGTLERLGNPLAGKLRPGEEALVDERLARDAARAREQQAHYAELNRRRNAEKGIVPAPEGEGKELMRLIEEQTRIQQDGRKTRAKVVARSEPGRTFANVPVVELTFEIEGRQVRFEHIYGPRHAKRYQPGKEVDVWIDPADPNAISPGR